MKDFIFGITWGAPKNLIFLPLIFLFIFVLVWCLKNKIRVIKSLAAPEHREDLIANFSIKKEIVKGVLIVAAVVLIFIAILRPQWGEADETVLKEGRDVIVALDISRSMLAEDIKPNRLERAKEKIKKLVGELEAERVGLLVFSGAAVMQCPLTTDHDAFNMFLNDVSTQTIHSGTTSIGSALRKVLEGIGVGGAKHSKIVLLFTDGEDFSDDLGDIKEKATKNGVKIFTIGVGTEEGAPIPLYDRFGQQIGLQKDEQSEIVISRLNSKLIRDLAHQTGGKYLKLKNDNSDVTSIKGWIERFEKEEFESRGMARLQEKYYCYAAVAFVLMLIEWVL